MEYSAEIEKLVYTGSGLARIKNYKSAPGAAAVFIDNSAPGDIVKAKITKEHKDRLEAEIVEIIQPSVYRVKPFCPLSKICGSCTWQHIDYNEQLNQKKIILKDTFKKTAGIDITDIAGDIIPSPKIKEYRCKVKLPFSQTKTSKRLLSGYYKKKSHELINIKYCPVQPGIINDIMEFLKEHASKLGLEAYSEKYHKGLIRHVICRISSDLRQVLIIFVINADFIDDKLKKLSELLMNAYPQIIGICADFNTKKTNAVTGSKIEIIAGNDYYTENLDGIKYKISALSFFQVNPFCAKLIFKRVKELAAERLEKPSILDAYSGVSSFGIYLSTLAGSVTSIEESKSAYLDALENIRLNNINNLTPVNGDAAKEFEKLINSGAKFDIAVTDPPRKGCSMEALNYLSKLASKYIIYVSCNPVSLARDIKLLAEKNFKLEYIQPADMFPGTYHIETIAVLKNCI